MLEQFSRTELLIGKERIQKLKNSKVIIYGIGGVGSYIVEGLARAGIEHIIIVDYDKVDITNINRQIEALHSTIGKYKVDVMKQRILDINPRATVEAYKPDEIEGGEEQLIDSSITYVVDAIDTITNKIKVIEKANKEKVKIISATGAGNKLNPTMFEIADIYKQTLEQNEKKHVPGSISFVPSVAGLIIASEVVKDLIK